jgi:SAM-dependent methyltransferase
MSNVELDFKNNQCAFCNSRNIALITDFGNMGLAGGFLAQDELEQEFNYPMNLCFCSDCYAVQIVDRINPDLMFKKNYFYFSSSIATLRNHFKEYAADVVGRFLSFPQNATVIEFGCNDGVLLSPLADLNVGRIIGVDPATNVVEKINDDRVDIVNSYFDEVCAGDIVDEFGQADLILANNVFAHVDDINALTRAIDIALSENGAFIFEVHYLGKIIEEMQYDMIYHEHIYYYSLLAVENHFSRYDMLVFDLKEVDNHGGSIRLHVCRNNSNLATPTSNVRQFRESEITKGFNNISIFREFGRKINNQKADLLRLLNDLKEEQKTVIGYGASGRANTMLQFCGIDSSLIKYMVDDAPAKKGFYTPGSHLRIESKIPLSRGEKPDYVVVFAWTFLKEIFQRNIEYLESGGLFIIPLPKVKILDIKSLRNLYSVK